MVVKPVAGPVAINATILFGLSALSLGVTVTEWVDEPARRHAAVLLWILPFENAIAAIDECQLQQ